MSDERTRMQVLRENGAKPARITGDGKVFIGDEQILPDHPISDDGISVARWHGRLNLLTLTLVVGEVTMELKPRRSDDETEDGN